jgi:predicted TIM-barrel fold metal-dependent hydrolase
MSAELRGFDADNHYYEALDAFTRHIEPAFAKRCMQWATIDGKTRLLVGGKISRFLANPTFHQLSAPGSLENYFRGKNESGASVVELFGELEPCRPEYRDRDARLRVMDDQRLDGAFFFPTLGVGMEQSLKNDLPAAAAAFRAFNRWMDEDWGFHYQERIFAAPYLSLIDPANAVSELQWAASRGARIAVMQAGPVKTEVGYRSPADPMFEPFWSALEESGITLAYHSGDTVYSEILPMWGEDAQLNAHGSTVMRALISAVPIADTLSALIAAGVFTRHPGLRVATIESGSQWVPQLFKTLGKHAGQAPGRYPEHPHDVFRRHVWVAPFYEDDLAGLKDLIGVDRIMLGSDWPHTEGLAEPLAFVKDLERDGYTEAEQQAVLRDNAAALVQPARAA